MKIFSWHTEIQGNNAIHMGPSGSE